MLNREFSVANFASQGVIIDHFPMHHFTLRGRIEKDFRKYFWTIILSSFIFQKGKHENSLRSITNVAFYLGIQHGFYFGFIIQLTTYMAPLAFIGLGFYIYGLSQKDVFDNAAGPWIAIVISLWVTLFIENWKRKEKYLSLYFDTLGSKEDEKIRFEYVGNYYVDSTTKKVIKHNSFTTFKKRMLVDLPLFLVGLLMIVPTFFLFDYLTDAIIEDQKSGRFTATQSLIYQ